MPLRNKVILIFIGLIGVFILSLSAKAHVTNYSYSDLKISSQKAHWRVMLHPWDYEHLFKGVSENKIKNYFTKQLKLKRGGKFCTVESVHLSRETQRALISLDFNCESFSGDLTVFYDLFFGDWNHRHIAQIHWGEKSFSQVFSPTQNQFNLSGPSIGHAIFTYLKLGFEHILEGYDHLLFLLTLILGARKLSHLLWLVSTFTLAHSLSLAFATLDLVNLSPQIVEPGIAASIIILAFLDFRSSSNQDIRGMILLTFLFGLIHGLGFSSILKESGIHGKNVLLPLFSFNGGVELGQILIVSILYPLLKVLQKKAAKFYYLGRKISLVMIVAVSGYWLITRLL